jgi:hypothetical protein
MSSFLRLVEKLQGKGQNLSNGGCWGHLYCSMRRKKSIEQSQYHLAINLAAVSAGFGVLAQKIFDDSDSDSDGFMVLTTLKKTSMYK